mgnify:CR=1 FL=1
MAARYQNSRHGAPQTNATHLCSGFDDLRLGHLLFHFLPYILLLGHAFFFLSRGPMVLLTKADIPSIPPAFDFAPHPRTGLPKSEAVDKYGATGTEF